MSKISTAAEGTLPNVASIDRPGAAELVGRAKALIPVLREREADAIRNRQVPVETIQAFRESGFFRILQPVRYGGFEMSPAVCGFRGDRAHHSEEFPPGIPS